MYFLYICILNIYLFNFFLKKYIDHSIKLGYVHGKTIITCDDDKIQSSAFKYLCNIIFN